MDTTVPSDSPIKGLFYGLIVSSLILLVSVIQGPKIVNDGTDDHVLIKLYSSLKAMLPEHSELQLEDVELSDEKAKAYPWSSEMLSWQRTSYHFQPQKNWMNDPNALSKKIGIMAYKLELTPIYFYTSKEPNGSAKTHFCADQSRSSKAPDVAKPIYGSNVPVLRDEKLSMRILVDHSIIESFAQGGRMVITSRVYPTKAINRAAKLFVFNNATGVSVTASVKAWQMTSAKMNPFPPNGDDL